MSEKVDEKVEIFPGLEIEPYVPPPRAPEAEAPFAQEHVPSPDLGRPRRRAAAAASGALDRLPPHSIEAEQGVLGCMFLDPAEAIGKCIEKLKAGAECFYDLRHREVYGTMLDFHHEGSGVDLITVQQRLKDKNQLEAVGGLAYLSSLTDAVPSASNLEYYLGIVREKHLLRRLLQTCTTVIGRVHEFEGEADQVIDWIEAEVIRVRQGDVLKPRLTMSQSMQNAMDRYNAGLAGTGDYGLDGGIYALRKYVRGFQRKDMILIAGRPSSGKSSLATSLAINMAITMHVQKFGKVVIFTLESPRDQVIDRCVQSIGGLSLRDIRDFNEEEQRTLLVAVGRMNELPILIEDERLNIDQMRSRLRYLVEHEGVEIAYIDYAEKVESTLHPSAHSKDRMKQIGDTVKSMAVDFNIPIVLLCQMNRESEKLARKPILADLAESDSLGREADIVAMLSKPKADLMEKDTLEIATWIEKNRNGPTGKCMLLFRKYCTRYESPPVEIPDEAP